MWYGDSFLGLELGSSFSPPLAEDLLAPAFFYPSFKEMHYFFRHCRHMARQRVCITRRFDFSTAFTVDLLKNLWDQDRYLVLDEISTSQLFSSAFIFNSQNWISTRILRVCKHEFRALRPSYCVKTGEEFRLRHIQPPMTQNGSDILISEIFRKITKNNNFKRHFLENGWSYCREILHDNLDDQAQWHISKLWSVY